MLSREEDDAMMVWQYLCIVICLVGLGLTTVAEHVKRVRLGYELRRLEQDYRRLTQERKARRLIWERHAAVENLTQRAIALNILEPGDAEAIQVAATEGRPNR